MLYTVSSNAKTVQDELARAGQRLADTTPLMREVGVKLEINIQHRFDAKRDPSGRAWEPYKAISAAIYEAIHGKKPPGSLMDRTGNLRRGVESHAGKDTVEVGLTAREYAKFHEFGTKGRGKKGGGAIPRRGMVFGAVTGVGAAAQVTRALSESDEADVLQLVQEHVQRAMGA